MNKLVALMFEDDRGIVCVECIEPEEGGINDEEIATPIHDGDRFMAPDNVSCERCGDPIFT